MNRLSASFLFLLAGTFTFAQTSSNPPTVPKNLPADIFVRPTLISGCPVGFFASRQANGQIMSANDGPQAGPAQGLHLKLNHLSSTPDIQSIEVKVYGTSPKERVLPVGRQATDTVSKTFELQRQTGTDSLSDADVWMHKVGSLSWVDLISITYADGATWHATESLKCRAVPSNFILVGSK
jgi:hypothetical protein